MPFEYKSLRGPRPPLVPTCNYDEAQPDWVFPDKILPNRRKALPKRTEDGELRKPTTGQAATIRLRARQALIDKRVLEFFKKNRRKMSIDDITACGLHRNVCTRSLARLEKAKLIERIEERGAKEERPKVSWKINLEGQ